MRYLGRGKYDSSVRFSRGYKGGRKSSDINSGPLTEAYRRGCELMGGDWDRMQRYCATCGCLPAWCECATQDERQENHG
jgi:hypothetical protein